MSHLSTRNDIIVAHVHAPLPPTPPHGNRTLTFRLLYICISLFDLDLDLDIFPYNNINRDTTIGTHKWSNGSLEVDQDTFYLTCLFALKLTISISGHFDRVKHKAEQAAFMIGTSTGVFLRLT